MFQLPLQEAFSLNPTYYPSQYQTRIIEAQSQAADVFNGGVNTIKFVTLPDFVFASLQ